MNRVLLATGVLAALVLGIAAASITTNPALALALAVSAVAVASVTLLAVGWPEPNLWVGARRPSTAGVALWRDWVQEGEIGREETVLMLDRIDRMGAHPNLPMRTEREMATFRRMPRAQFFELVDRRLDEIEGPS